MAPGPARSSRQRLAGPLAAGIVLTAAAVGAAQVAPLTVERLAALKASANDPAGDAFSGSQRELGSLVDAFVADSALAGPLQLFLASNTALRLKRVEDAAFLFYAAQIRVAFDFARFDVPSRADGSNAATYLGFLRHTIGEQVNPAIMREPKRFAAVVSRLERWPVVPAATAHYPEFPNARVKLPRAKWEAEAASIKASFLTTFARRALTLLNDAEYFRNFLIVQDAALGSGDPDPAALTKVDAALERMAAAEARLFPGEPAQTPQPAVPPRRVAPQPAPPPPPPPHEPTAGGAVAAGDAPVRVGGRIPEARPTTRVEPEFPPGSRGAVILEVTIGRDGKVSDVRVLRSEPGLEEPAVRAVRQWVFEPVIVDGVPVAVIQPIVVSRR